jgi:tRNA A-37 threonylcarbamoyl transferase component Bud32
MLTFKKTSTLAVRHVFDPHVMGTVAEVAVKDGAKALGHMGKEGATVLGHVAEEVAGKLAGDWVKKVAENVRSHFTDHSERLTEALARSNERAWKTIEIALGGQRFWDRFAPAEDYALREQVREFLESAVAGDDPDYLTACLKELRQAREKGHLEAGDGFRPESLAEEVGPFARFDDPEALLEAECAVVGEVAREFQRLGYRHLGRLLAVTPTRGQPLLAMAVQYYFRRAVGEDAVLSRELTWTKMVEIDRRVQDRFAFLASIQERHGRTLEEALDGLVRVEGVVVETRDAVLDLHANVRGLTDQFRLLRRQLTAGDSVSYRDERERALIEEVKQRYRALSDDQRRRFPQLGLDLSRLEIVAGDFGDALGQAREAACHIEEPASKAEAHHAAYRAALELKSWDEALAELQQAAAADPRFAAWLTPKYQAERILGTGAFGVAFLCRDTDLDRQVVIKTFETTGIDRDAATVFREARILDGLRHAGIIHLYGCGYVDPVRKQRPYLEIAHFPDSLTLEDHVRQHGPLPPDDLLPVAVQIAEALQAAHSAGVLHRDVKARNVLVRKTSRGWEVKVIDFGLSLRRSLVQTSQVRAASLNRSMVGSAVAGTLHYAAPEQLDPDRSREVGPHSDVFGFGRTCLFALFKTTQPRAKCQATLKLTTPATLKLTPS